MEVKDDLLHRSIFYGHRLIGLSDGRRNHNQLIGIAMVRSTMT
jgi:hypothetical protein